MPTNKEWKVGDKARLSPVTVGGKPEYFTVELQSGPMRMPSEKVPDRSIVEIVVVIDAIWHKVKIVDEGSTLHGAWADVIVSQLQPMDTFHKKGNEMSKEERRKNSRRQLTDYFVSPMS